MPRAWTVFRAALFLSTALMMAISWPLWVTGGEFPRVPWFGWVRLLPAWASWVRFAAAMAAIVGAAVPWRWKVVGRRSLIAALVLSAWMVLEDQFRLQPWMYQFLLMGLAIAFCDARRAARLCRLFLIATYLHSGLTKLDPIFFRGMGAMFAYYPVTWLGFRPLSWGPGEAQRRLEMISVALPCWEIAVACGFAFGARRTAIVGAVVQHVALIAILGPWALDHSTIVLLWNAVLIFEVVPLFSSLPPEPEATASRPARYLAGGVSVLMVGAFLLPFTERWGLWDRWPSFALYAANDESDIMLRSPASEFVIPPPPFTGTGHYAPLWPGAGLRGPYAERIDVSAWSLHERHVPLYPSVRAANGLAEAFAKRNGGPNGDGVLVDHRIRRGRRDRWTQSLEFVGREAIRKYGDTFWLNAHPAD